MGKLLEGSILVHDCWAAQLKIPAKQHQVCMAHLQRDFNEKYRKKKFLNAFNELKLTDDINQQALKGNRFDKIFSTFHQALLKK